MNVSHRVVSVYLDVERKACYSISLDEIGAQAIDDNRKL